MELIFLDEGCDVFMIENAIKLDEKNWRIKFWNFSKFLIKI
jgi:hypothetical protein